MLLLMLYGIYSTKYYYFIINENNFSLMSQLREAPTTIAPIFEDIKTQNSVRSPTTTFQPPFLSSG